MHHEWEWLMLRRMAFLLIGLSLTTPAMADDALASVLTDMVVGCNRIPDATPVLIALQREHRIGKPAESQVNDEGCWRVKPAIVIWSLQFQYICATNPELAKLLPDLYFSGPGAQSNIELRLLTTAPVAEVQRWWDEFPWTESHFLTDRIGPDPGYYPLPNHDKLSQIECSENDMDRSDGNP